MTSSSPLKTRLHLRMCPLHLRLVRYLVALIFYLLVKQLHPVLIQATDEMVLWSIPLLDPMNGWNLAHLFAGGFGHELFAAPLGPAFLPLSSGLFSICGTGSWIAFVKFHDIKGNSFLCSLLDTALVRYERICDFKLDFEDPSPSTHASFTSQIGAVFGGYDLQVKQLHPVLIQAKDDVVLWSIPRLDPMNGWNLAHLFAGSFSGWLQAFNRSVDQIFIDPQVTVELDTRIAFAWSASVRHELFAAPLGPGFLPPPSGHFGICGTAYL